MLEIFRKDFIFNALLLVPYCALLRIKSLLYPSVIDVPPEYGIINHQWLYFFNSYPRLGAVVSILFISVLGFFVNYLSNHSRVYTRKSLFPAVLFILICSLFDNYLLLLPVHIALMFLLIALFSAFSTYKNNRCADVVFNVGFFLSIASLFYLPFVVFYVFGFLAIITMKSFRWKDRTQYTIGFLVPYFLFFTFTYVMNFSADFWSQYALANIQLPNLKWPLGIVQLSALIGFGLIMVIVVFQYNSFISKKSIQVRKNIDILYWACILSIPGVFFWKYLSIDHLLILAIPLAIFLSMILLRIKNKFAVELIHGLVVLGVFYLQFFI